jgi:hypothetical protein
LRRLALITCAVAVLAGCSAPRAAVRPLPVQSRDVAFLVISNQARAPIVLGSLRASRGLRVSRSGGRRWSLVPGDRGPALAIAFDGGTAIVSRGATYSVFDRGVQRILRDGMRWPFAGSVSVMAYEPRHFRIWALAGRRLWYTRDVNGAWTERSAAGLCAHPLALAASPTERGSTRRLRLYAACGPDGLYASDDLGRSFSRLQAPAGPVVSVATTSAESKMVVVAGIRVMISHDRGETFTAAPAAGPVVAIDTRNTRLIFVVGADGKLHISTDGGATF